MCPNYHANADAEKAGRRAWEGAATYVAAWLVAPTHVLAGHLNAGSPWARGPRPTDLDEHPACQEVG